MEKISLSRWLKTFLLTLRVVLLFTRAGLWSLNYNKLEYVCFKLMSWPLPNLLITMIFNNNKNFIQIFFSGLIITLRNGFRKYYFNFLWQCNVWYTVGISTYRKNFMKTMLWIMVELTYVVRSEDFSLRMRPLVLLIGPYGDALRTSGRFSWTSFGPPWDTILPSGYGILK